MVEAKPMSDERKRQKKLLSGMYKDYDPKRHTAFVIRYNKNIDDARISAYNVNRGIE